MTVIAAKPVTTPAWAAEFTEDQLAEAAENRICTKAGYSWQSFDAAQFTKFAGADPDDWSDTDRAGIALIEKHGSAVYIVDEAGGQWFAPDNAETYHEFNIRMLTRDTQNSCEFADVKSAVAWACETLNSETPTISIRAMAHAVINAFGDDGMDGILAYIADAMDHSSGASYYDARNRAADLINKANMTADDVADMIVSQWANHTHDEAMDMLRDLFLVGMDEPKIAFTGDDDNATD